MRPAGGADNCAVLVMPNVKVKLETQHSLPLVRLYNLLRESFNITFIWQPVLAHWRTYLHAYKRLLISNRALSLSDSSKW
jgi:hypothetical protein